MQKRYGGVPRQIIEDLELRALIIPILRADVELMETYYYTPEPPLDCAITVFAGTTDHTVRRSMLDAWQCQTNQTFKLHFIKGGHFFLHSAQRDLINLIAADSQMELKDQRDRTR